MSGGYSTPSALLGREALEPAPQDLGAGEARLAGEAVEETALVGVEVDLEGFANTAGRRFAFLHIN